LEEHFEIPPESLWQCAAEWIAYPPAPLNSQIISEFPKIFAVFKRKHFELLWRGSRDGFRAKEFHRRCDGHANTMTVILDTDGNIFGGFTPLGWESRVWNRKYGKADNCLKRDDSQKSFLFTLKNPHNIAARRFVLNAEKKHEAIDCDSEWGPRFYAMAVSDNCNITTNSGTSLGSSSTNDTGLNGKFGFAGSTYFRVKNIEVFEITDYTALQTNSSGC
jgi:hypothetical protein